MQTIRNIFSFLYDLSLVILISILGGLAGSFTGYMLSLANCVIEGSAQCTFTVLFLYLGILLGTIICAVIGITGLLRDTGRQENGVRILIVFLGALGYVIAVFIYQRSPFYLRSAFTPWQRLTSPHKISHIVGIRVEESTPRDALKYMPPLGGCFHLDPPSDQMPATSVYSGILVETEDRRYFSYFIDTKKTDDICDLKKDRCEEWVEVSPQETGRWSADRIETDCTFNNYELDSLAPPLLSTAHPIECATVDDDGMPIEDGAYGPYGFFGYYLPYFGYYRTEAYYVLLDNGELWVWKFEQGKYDRLFNKLTGGIFGVLIGFILRMIILRRNRKSAG